MMDYKSAGVDIEAGYRSVELMKEYVARTMRPEVMGGLGGFSGAFSLAGIKEMDDPVLLSGTDGVGTKLKLAFLMDRHDTVGIDCVAMCVNDVACAGGEPLFFLDYIACGKNVPEKIAQIVKGVCDGCEQAGAALIGGETAEMPGFYPVDEYDLAGYCTGIVDKDKIIDNSRMAEGDIIIALPSSGVHSNGFSLVRRVFALDKPDLMAMKAGNTELGGKSLGDVLLEPTKIYVKPILALIDRLGAEKIKGISHITGGGFYENIPRSIPAGLTARIARKAIRVLPIFDLIAKVGVISDHDMFNTFNMGVGMTVIVSREDAPVALNVLRENGEDAYVIGVIARGSEKITIE